MMSAIDTQIVKDAATALEKARTTLARAIADYKTVKSLGGQEGYEVSVNGIRVSVALMDSRTYMAALIRGREMIHLGALKALQARIDDCKATVVFLESKLRATVTGDSP